MSDPSVIPAAPREPAAGIRPLTLLGDPSAVACEGDACVLAPPEPAPGR